MAAESAHSSFVPGSWTTSNPPGVLTYLRYLSKLRVCLAALVRRLYGDLIVVHKGPVHAQLAGLRTSHSLLDQTRLYCTFTMYICIHRICCCFSLCRSESTTCLQPNSIKHSMYICKTRIFSHSSYVTTLQYISCSIIILIALQ